MMEQDYNIKHWTEPCRKVDCRKNSCKCGIEKVFIPAAMGDDSEGSPIAPANGAYCNALVVYEANGHKYIYSKEGIPTLITSGGGGDYDEIIKEIQDDLAETEDDLAKEVLDRVAGDNTLQDEIDAIKNSPDVVDIVPTYAALQAYDTSKLGDNDIIRVLQDEQHDGQSTYYRWNATTSSWTYIGAVGDYYTKGQVDTLLTGKQDTLTAGANITISANNEISATDTTYTHFTGATASTDGVQGLVPGPLAGDEDKFLKADGTWATAGGGGPTVVQSTGISTADVMSQKAVTDELYPQYSAHSKGVIGIGDYTSIADYGGTKIGIGRVELGNSSAYAVAIHGGDSGGTVNAISALGIWAGNGGTVTGHSGVAIGNGASVSAAGGVAIGRDSSATSQGEFNIGSSSTSYGYNNTNYRLLTGVHDPVNAHDAATKGYVDSQGGGVTPVQTTGTSTTDVMSQNATTSMIFADPGTDTKVRIGYGAVVNKDNGIAIGNGANVGSTATSGTSIGHSSSVIGNYSTAVGYSAGSRLGGVSLGGSAKAGTSNSHYYTTALGYNAQASASGSVALGSYSSASTVGEINVGSSNTSYGYNSSNYRLISGVYDGQGANDAATVGQINATIDAINTALSTNIPHIGA